MDKKRKILITGSTGFLGTILKDILQKEFEVDTLSRTPGATYNADVSNTVPELRGFYDYVIHSAGKAHTVPRSKAEEQLFFAVNFHGTKNLCYSLEHLNSLPRSFIYISTVAVYGVDEGVLINESDPLNGKSPYAKSKIMAEEWLTEWAKKYGVKLTVLRLPLIAGPNPQGNLKSMINAIKYYRYFSIGNANANKSIVWAEDIAGIIPIAAEVGGTYNLTDGYHPSFDELEKTIATALGKKYPVKISKNIAQFLGYLGDMIGNKSPINTEKIKKITSTLTFDDTKARKLLNWEPSKVLTKLPEIL